MTDEHIPRESDDHTQASTEDQLQQAKNEMSGYERATLRWTKATCFVAGIAAFLVGLQWYVMKGQLDQMTSSGEQTDNLIIQAISQNKATNMLAQQAERSADIAEKTLKTNEALSKIALKQSIVISRLEQRAWVSVLSVPNIKPQIGEPLNIPIKFKNTGKTPAINVTALAGVLVVKKGVKPTFSYNDISVPVLSRGPILPNDEKTTEISIEDSIRKPADGKITKESLDYLSSGKEIMYLHGKITYDDIFAKPHWTTFCYIYNPVDGDSTICEEHNDMDK